jgi:hypothetical protein
MLGKVSERIAERLNFDSRGMLFRGQHFENLVTDVLASLGKSAEVPDVCLFEYLIFVNAHGVLPGWGCCTAL